MVDKPKSSDEKNRNTIAAIILYVDYFTAVYFTIEYVVRIVCTPRKLKFVVQPLNVVDLLAILPYFINMILDHLSEFHIIGRRERKKDYNLIRDIDVYTYMKMARLV